jgi:NAD(P)-dependent dehydrogenase (short-subunit alcohol dehydrogenase family)
MGEARFDLDGKVVLVTVRAGALVVSLRYCLHRPVRWSCRPAEPRRISKALCARLPTCGLSVHPTLLDVRDVVSIAAAVDQVVAGHGKVDVLVNNAGLGHGHRGRLGRHDGGQRPWRLLHEPSGRPSDGSPGGRIFNVSSQGGLVGLPNAVVYCTSKGR